MENALFTEITEEEAMNYDGGFGWLSKLGAGLLIGGGVVFCLAMSVLAPPVAAATEMIFGAAAAAGIEGMLGGLGCLIAD